MKNHGIRLAVLVLSIFSLYPHKSFAAYFEMKLDGKTVITENEVQSAYVLQDPVTLQPTANFKLTEAATKMFQKITGENTGKKLGIFVNGKKLLAPVISAQIDSGTITIGHGPSSKEIKEIASALNSVRRASGVVPGSDLTYQYFGTPLSNTLRLVKLAPKDLNEPAEILQSVSFAMSRSERFAYQDKISCSFQSKPIFAVIPAMAAVKTKPFVPSQAWVFNSADKTLKSVSAEQVLCQKAKAI